jgi:hypothetical protein
MYKFLLFFFLAYFPLSAVHIGVETIEERDDQSKRVNIKTNIYVSFSQKHPNDGVIHYQNIKQPELVDNLMKLIHSHLRKQVSPNQGVLEEISFENIKTQKHVSLIERLFNSFAFYYGSNNSNVPSFSRLDQDMYQAAHVTFSFNSSPKAPRNIINQIENLNKKFQTLSQQLDQENLIYTKYSRRLTRQNSLSSNEEGYYDKLMGRSFSSSEEDSWDLRYNSSEEDEGRSVKTFNNLRF